MSFDDLFKQAIPTVEAATFFTELTKQAEWTDPPDMEGLLEGKFNVPLEQVLDKLKGVITAKYRKMVAYYTYAQSVNDLAGDSMAAVFENIAYDEKCGAKFYTQRAAALGGPVHLDPIEPPPASTNPVGIIKIMIRAEQEGIAAQRELRQCVGDENAMRMGIESQMEKDQHHLDELWQLLPKSESQALELGGEMPPMGGEPPPAPMEGAPPEAPPEAAEAPPMEEAPPEEKMASFRMDLALMKTALDPLQAAMAKGKGEERGVTSMAAEAAREQGRRGERTGKTVGMLGGGAAGAALGQKYLGGGALGTLGGMAAGALAGRGVGSELGTEVDISRNKSRGTELGSADQQAIERDVSMKGDNVQRVMGPKDNVLGYTASSDQGSADPNNQAAMQAYYQKMHGAGTSLQKAGSADELIASMRMEAALHKLAQEPGLPGDTAGDGMASPATGEMQPQNYLASEMQAQQAQDGNEANYYREQLGQAQQTATMAQQQMGDVQAQLDQLQQQADQSGQQIQSAAQEAMAARDDAVNATMEVAKARIGAQKMRQQMLELASQDPAQLGEEAMPGAQPAMGPDGQPMGGGAPMGPEGQPGAPPGEPGVPDAGMEAPPEPGGPAGAAPPPATAPGAAPPDGGADMTAPVGPPPGPDPAGAMPAGQMKTGSAALLGGLGGAALGAGASYMAGRQAPALRDRVQQLEGTQDGSFGQAAALATAQGLSAAGDLASAHPGRAALSAGLTGGLTGSALGSGVSSGARELGGHMRTIGGAAKRHFGG